MVKSRKIVQERMILYPYQIYRVYYYRKLYRWEAVAPPSRILLKLLRTRLHKTACVTTPSNFYIHTYMESVPATDPATVLQLIKNLLGIA